MYGSSAGNHILAVNPVSDSRWTGMVFDFGP